MSNDYTSDPARPARAPSGWSLLGPLLLLIAGAAALAWLLGFFGGRSDVVHEPAAQPRPVTARGDLADDERATIELFQRASPSVVHITTLQYDRFSLNPDAVPAGTG